MSGPPADELAMAILKKFGIPHDRVRSVVLEMSAGKSFAELIVVRQLWTDEDVVVISSEIERYEVRRVDHAVSEAGG